jgi:putative transposase
MINKEAQAVRRLPPSVLVQEELDRLMHGGVEADTNLISALVETATRLVVQQLLEADQADFLGRRGRYQRRSGDQRGWRNGYERGRVRTAEGPIEVAVPQVRDADQPYRSSLMSFLDGNSEVLERLVVEMYARGLSTRDVEDAFRDVTGELLISKSAVSQITDQLWEDYQVFITRDLSDIEVQYLFCDAIFESLRRQGAKEALLVAWCIDSDGRKHLLHLQVGKRESEAAWSEMFRNLVGRGLRAPTTVTSDGAPGLVKAIEAVFASSVRIRCWFHRLSNIRAKLPDDEAAEVMAHLYAIRDAPTLDAARAAADRFENSYIRSFPSAVACFADDRDALLAIHRVPVRHRIRVRTTNLAERSFEEERRRTKVIPRLMSERATLKLAFATMIRAAGRWSRVSINDIERHQLRLLRTQLGLDPPPATTQPTRRRRTTDRTAA